MAATGTDTGRWRDAPSARPKEPPSTTPPRAALGPTFALTMSLAIACFAIVLGVVMLLTHPVPVPNIRISTAPTGLHLFENQKAESALYAVAFAVILPLALFAVPRLADRIAAGPNAAGLSVLVAFLTSTLAALILLTRLLPGGGDVIEVLAAVGAWSIGAALLLARARRPPAWGALLRVAGAAPRVWTATGVAVLFALIAFTSPGSISLVALVLVGVAVLVVRRGNLGLPRLSRGWGFGIDTATIVLLLWVIPNLVIFSTGPLGPYNALVVQFHHNLWLGPVNEVLAGRPLLVDTAAQYGIAPIYLLAAWFQLAPIGYGTLGFLDGVLFALLFAAGYCVLRLAGTSRLLATGALALGVVVLIYNLAYSVGFLPQHGPLRFGLPMALILAATAGERWPQRERAAQAAGLFVVGLASIWALEAFAYTAFTFAAIGCFRAWTRPGPGRLRWLGWQAALALAASLAAHLVFVALTLAFTGALPDYGWYLAFLHAFVLGKLGDVTYDYSPWSAGLPVGAAYAASAAGLVLLVRRRRDIVERERTALVALCGTSAYGIALYTYFVDRSLDHVLPYVSLPALLAGALWLSLLLRRRVVGSPRVRLGALAFAVSLAALLFSVAWSSIGPRFSESPLAYAFPGGSSLSGALHGLWHPPPLDPNAPEGERLLDKYMPGQSRVPIIVSPGLATEILIRSGRSNQLAFSDPLEDSFVRSQTGPALRRTVGQLQPGDRLLMQAPGLKAFAVIQRQPGRDVFKNPVPDSSLLRLQEWVLQRIAERFRLRVIHRDPQGFVAAALEPR